ncbi:MAG: DUF1492 domain-containing protein [Firmicutes bacterium]|nr:DUF1492 domain-containing protein [Bacillota bacterium]
MYEGSAKQCLMELNWMEQEIECKMEEMDRLRRLAEGASSLRQKGGETERIQSIVDKLRALEERLGDEVDSFVSLKAFAEKAISGLDKPELRTVLRLKYIEKHTIEAAAERMGYSAVHTARLHKRALMALNEPMGLYMERCLGAQKKEKD